MTTEDLYERLQHIKIGGTACHYSYRKCEEFIPLINEINYLKKEKNAVILVHSYISPEIIYGVGDFIGDSYELSKKAMSSEASLIIFVAVRFMAETAKILNPHKDVLLPNSQAGCSLAESVSSREVRELRKRYPDHSFVCYINTTAKVKAECDVCVTSSNACDVISHMPNNKIYFLPDRLMGRNIQLELERRGIKKEVLFYGGDCYVHRDFNEELIHKVRLEAPDAKILSHPECNPSICQKSDFVGSTSQMINYINHSQTQAFMLLSECGLGNRVQVEFPDKEIIGACALCRYMKSNRLEDILRVLKSPRSEDFIHVPPDVQKKASQVLEKMIVYVDTTNSYR